MIFFRFSLIKEYHFPNSKYIILQFILQIMYCKLYFESDNFIFFIEKLFRKFKYNKE